jgi:hypothetical protein
MAMTTVAVLESLAEIGKSLVRNRDNVYRQHAFNPEYRPGGSIWEARNKAVIATRDAYRSIRDGANAWVVLTHLQKNHLKTGIEANSLSRLVEAIES